MQKTIIIGGGLAGLMSAYHLTLTGEKVLIIDSNTNTYRPPSLGNAGLISPFGKGPFADPNIIKQMLKLYALGKAPFSVHPRLKLETLQWFMRFFASAKTSYVQRTEALWQQYGTYALQVYADLHQKLDNFNFHNDGLLFLFNQNEKEIYHNKVEHIHRIDAEWQQHQNLSTLAEIQHYFPLANDEVYGGVVVQGNGWLNPDIFINNFKKYLIAQGVEFINEEVQNIEQQQTTSWLLQTPSQTHYCENLVLATGANLSLLKHLKRSLPLIPVKGYHIDLKIPTEQMPQIATILNGAFTVMTPQQDFIRLTARLEFNAKFYKTPAVREKMLRKVIGLAEQYTQPFERKIVDIWSGFRPLTANDLPLFGRDACYPNLIHANGLGWQGNSFSPIVGKAVTELITNNKENEEVDEIMRFSGLINKR